MSGARFFHSRLTEAEREAYDLLARGLANYRSEISTPPLPGGIDSVRKVADAVLCDNPSLCFCEIEYVYSAKKAAFQINWQVEKGEARRIAVAMKSATDKILAGLPHGASDYDKELYLHDWFVRHMRYQECPESDKRGHLAAHTPIGPLLHQSGVCEGFAKAMALLLRRAGLSAVVVSGQSCLEQGESRAHAWNCVEIGGRFYHLDVTWGITMTQKREPIQYDYFNLPDREIMLDHSDYTAPSCTDEQGGYFVRNKLCAAGPVALGKLIGGAAARRAEHFTFKIMPAKNGYPPDVSAAVGDAVKKLGIVASWSVSINPRQHVVMLSDMKYRQ